MKDNNHKGKYLSLLRTTHETSEMSWLYSLIQLASPNSDTISYSLRSIKSIEMSKNPPHTSNCEVFIQKLLQNISKQT